MYKRVLREAFVSWRFLASILIISTGLFLWICSFNLVSRLTQTGMPITNFSYALMGQPYRLGFLLVCTLSYGASFATEKSRNMDSLIKLRCKSKKKYIFSKIIANSLSTGTAVLIPLIIVFVSFILLAKSDMLDPEISDAFIKNNFVYEYLYKISPVLSGVAMIIKDYFAAMAWAAMGLAISCFTSRKLIIYFLPIVVYLFSEAISYETGIMFIDIGVTVGNNVTYMGVGYAVFIMIPLMFIIFNWLFYRCNAGERRFDA